MNRLNSINNISMYLSRFVVQTRALNNINQYGINYLSETVLIPVFKEIFGYNNLFNLNHLQNDFPGIDLGDAENKVAFQISSTVDEAKILHTLEQFNRKKHYTRFNKLFIYCITEKPEKIRAKNLQKEINNNFEFVIPGNVLDYRDLMKKIDTITEDDKINRVEHLLKNQFSDANGHQFLEKIRPSIQFTAEIVFHSKVKNYWIAELIAYVENKAKTQHRIYEFGFNLKAIKKGAATRDSPIKEDRGQVDFPEILIGNGKGSYLPLNVKYFFIEPEIKAKYSYLTRVHESMAVLSFHTWFVYPYTDEVHIAEATAQVPE